jgi:hypothetical protein
MRDLVTSIGLVALLACAQVGYANFVTSYSENFDESFSGANMNPSVQGNRVDDSQEQVGWADSPGYYVASGAATGAATKPWTTVSPATDFTTGDGALLLGTGAGQARTTSTADTMGLGTYSWEFEWEDFHGGLPLGGTDLHEEGLPTKPGEKRLNILIMSSNSGTNNGGDPSSATGGVQIDFGQTGEGGGLAVRGKAAGADEFLYTYSEHGWRHFYTHCPGYLTYEERDTCEPYKVNEPLWHTGAENRPWIKPYPPGTDSHTAGLKIKAEVEIVEDSPGVYLLDLYFGQQDDPATEDVNEYNETLVREINDLDISKYVSDVEGGVGSPNGYWNFAIGDSGWAKLDNLSFTGSDPPVVDGLPGDYNNSGTVDAADFTIYQDNLGGNSSVLNDNGSGAATVVQADYQLWKDNFGNTSSAASGSAVPEPGCLVLLAIALTAVSSMRPVPANR